MNKTISFLLIILSTISIWSCKNSDKQSNVVSESENTEISEKEPSSSLLSDAEYDAMANELCDCMQPLVDLQNKVNSLTADEIRAMVDEIEKISKAGDKCVEELEAKYGKVEGREAEEKAEEAFIKACPYVAGMTSN